MNSNDHGMNVHTQKRKNWRPCRIIISGYLDRYLKPACLAPATEGFE
jgi:hypothetical protein